MHVLGTSSYRIKYSIFKKKKYSRSCKTPMVCEKKSTVPVDKEDQSILWYKHQKLVWWSTTHVCHSWKQMHRQPSPAHKRAKLELKLKHVVLLVCQLGNLLSYSLHECRGGEAAQGHTVHVLHHLGQALLWCCARGRGWLLRCLVILQGQPGGTPLWVARVRKCLYISRQWQLKNRHEISHTLSSFYYHSQNECLPMTSEHQLSEHFLLHYYARNNVMADKENTYTVWRIIINKPK